MRFTIKLVVYSFVLSLFLLSGVAFAAQATADGKKSTDQCVKGGKAMPTAKTKGNCIKEGGSWVKMEAAKKPDDPFGKRKMPPDPLEKSKAGQIKPSGGQ